MRHWADAPRPNSGVSPIGKQCMAGPIDEWEIKANGNWVIIHIADALMLRKTDLRCRECGGRVRAHQNYMSGAKPHFVHVTGHTGCSTSPRAFSGVASRHPDALE